MAEQFQFQSPYLYGYNNPIRFIDFMGMNGQNSNEKEKKTVETSSVGGMISNLLSAVGLNIKPVDGSSEESLESTTGHNNQQAETRETIKEKADEVVETVKAEGELIARSAAGAAEVTGGVMELSGIPPVMAAGRGISTAGAVTNAALDYADGKYVEATLSVVTTASTGYLSGGVTNMQKAGKLTSNEASIVQVLVTTGNRIVSWTSSLVTNRNKDKER